MKYVTFHCAELKLNCRPKMTGPAVVVQHQGEGWQNVQKMWGISYTVWQGAPGYEIQIPCVFDQLRYNPATHSAMNSVEKEIRHMERMGEVTPPATQPPVVTFDSNGAIPHDKTSDPNKQWVIAVCAWGDYVLARNQVYRCRQEFTVTLWVYNPEKILAGKARLPDRPVPKTYRVKRHDTLPKLAVYFYGDQAMWHEIAALNKIKHPLRLKVGKVLKMPKVPVVGKTPTVAEKTKKAAKTYTQHK